MNRHLGLFALAIFVCAIASHSFTRGQDKIERRDKKTEKTSLVNGEIQEESGKGVTIKIIPGNKNDLIPPSEIVKVTYKEMPAKATLEISKMGDAETKRDYPTLLKGYEAIQALPEVKSADPKAKRYIDFRVAMLRALSAEGDEKLKDAIKALSDFLIGNAGTWEYPLAARTLARLQADTADYTGASKTYAALEKADVPMGVVFGQIEFENIDNAYTFFKTYCLQNQIGITDYKEDKFLTTRHISNLKVFDSDDNTEIKGSAVSVSGQGMKDFEIAIEGLPHNIFAFKFRHHVLNYKGLFDRKIDKDNIIEIGIDEKIGIYVKPETVKFPFIWRSASSIHWDDKEHILCTTNQSGWTHLQWYKQIIGAVLDEYGYELILTDKTIWTNIPDNLKLDIIEV